VFSVEQGRAIQAMVPDSRLVFSKMTVRRDGRRDEIIGAMRDGTVRCLIATSLAQEGLDIPRLNCLVRARGGRGWSRTETAQGGQRHTASIEQETARVLRQFQGKQQASVFDFLDHHHPFLHAAARSRIKGYEALGFDVRMPGEMF